jgi:hypothetical protein
LSAKKNQQTIACLLVCNAPRVGCALLHLSQLAKLYQVGHSLVGL